MKWIAVIGLCGLLAAGGRAAAAEKDLVTLRLKDGSSVTGVVRSEDAEQITVEAELASGTILQSRTIKKDDIAEITRLTAAQIAERDLGRDYDAIGKYQLDPLTSYPAAYYDQVIKGAFERFLVRHPDSPYENEILEKIIAWKKERDQVNTGQVKVHGKWVPREEGTRLLATERTERLLQQGEAYLVQGQCELAIQRLQEAATNAPSPELQQQTRALKLTAYRQWLENLDRQREQLEVAIQKAMTPLAHARQQEAQARAVQQKQAADPVQRMGTKATASQVEHAHALVTASEKQLADLRAQLAAVERQIGVTRARADKEGVPPTVVRPEKPAATVATLPPAHDPELLEGIAQWWKQWWLLIVVVAVAIIGGLLRVIMR